MRTAYLLVQIDPETRTVVSAGVFSEASPTGLLRLRWAIVDEVKADDFGEASRLLWRTIDHEKSQHAWLRPLLHRQQAGAPTLTAKATT